MAEDALNQQVIRASEMAVMQINEVLKRVPNAIGQTNAKPIELTKADLRRLRRE